MNGMTSAVATRDGDRLEAVQQAALAIKPGQLTWDEYQNAALNQLGLKNASNADRAVFLHQCQRTGLDPFARQIMMIERREKQGDNWVSKWTIQTGIEGWRTIRDRAERREGVRGVLSRFTYYDHEGTEHKVWVQQRPPIAVEVTYTVRDRNGVETPYTSVLRYDEYVQTKKVTQNGAEIAIPIAQWATKGVHMTEKCTEADVYRKTFPQDYAGIELTDAMPPAEHYDDEPVQQRQRVTAEQARNRAPQRATAEVVSVTPLAPTETIPVGTEHAGDGTQPPEPDPTILTLSAESPGTITAPQIKAIWTILTNVFAYPRTDEAGVHQLLARIVDHDVTSTKALSQTEAGNILDRLDGWRREAADASSSPRAYLDMLMTPADATAEGETTRA